jgi:hypothetical protein
MGDVVFIGTEWFWDYYSKSSPTNKLESLVNWCGNTWADEVDDGDYRYTPYIESGSDKVVVPESELPNNSSLGDRLGAADSWLVNNTTMEGWADVFVVADHYGFDSDDTYGIAYTNNAGSDSYITALVDLSYEDNGELPPAYSQVKSEGLAFHELCHVYSGDHKKGDTQSDGDASLMWDWNSVNCSDDGDGSLKKRYLSSCNVQEIRDYYDNNRSKF